MRERIPSVRRGGDYDAWDLEGRLGLFVAALNCAATLPGVKMVKL